MKSALCRLAPAVVLGGSLAAGSLAAARELIPQLPPTPVDPVFSSESDLRDSIACDDKWFDCDGFLNRGVSDVGLELLRDDARMRTSPVTPNLPMHVLEAKNDWRAVLKARPRDPEAKEGYLRAWKRCHQLAHLQRIAAAVALASGDYEVAKREIVLTLVYADQKEDPEHRWGLKLLRRLREIEEP